MTGQDSTALERLPCGWLRIDGRGIVLAANATLCRLLGRAEPELLGQSFDSLLTRPSRVLYQSHLQPLLHLHGHVEEFSLAFALPGGAVLDALVYSTVADPEGGGPQVSRPRELVVASVRKRRSIEDEMLRIKRAADHAPGMIFQLMQTPDGSCHFPYTSEAIRRMYGVTSQMASDSAEHLLGLLSRPTRATLSEGLSEAARAERDWQAVFEVQLPGPGTRWHEAHATPRRLANGVILWHGHCADVTERRALENALADRLALEKLHEARSEFLARVSHELRTPLHGILGFAQLLATDRPENLTAEQQDRLAVLTASGRHLLALVNELLEVTSLESGQLLVELHELELQPLLDLALRTAQVQADAVQVQLLPTECPADLWVRSNERRLQQVVTNLLSNAIKYNRPGGTVQVRVHRGESGVSLSVRDTGKGMSAEQCAALFQPFNRLGAESSRVEGHGLGLVISKHLLHLMGASLTVRSEPGQGSEFTVLMPAAAQYPAAAAPAAAAEKSSSPVPDRALPQARGNVLYVEDDDVNAMLMAAVLGMRPQLQLQIATDVAQAMERVREQTPDLLLIDMHLPGGSGIELLAAMRQIDGLQAVPAIMVSAGARQQDIERAMQSGFVGYWTKPLDIDQALAQLDRLLASDRPPAHP